MAAAPCTSSAASSGGAVAAAAASAPSCNYGAGAASEISSRASTTDKLLAELRTYYEGACRERAEFRRERAELNAKLLRLDHELASEENIGRDLTKRIETLETAITRERLRFQNASGDSSTSASNVGVAQAAFAAAEAPDDDRTDPAAVYASGLSKLREQSCRDVLRARLEEAGCLHVGEFRHAEGVGHSSSGLAFRGRNLEYSSRAWMGEAMASEADCDSRSRHAVDSSDRQDDMMQDGGAKSSTSRVENGMALDGSPLPSWRRRWTLRSHLDAARCVLSDEDGEVLISCGEDSLIKCWSVDTLRRGLLHVDELEPYATIRGHTASVLTLAYRPPDRIIFSAGMDHCIRAWRLPDCRTHNAYGTNLTSLRSSLRAGLLLGHTDSVWCLQQHPHLHYLASASADGSVGLWSAELETMGGELGMEAALTLQPPGCSGGEVDVPTCLSWVPSDIARLMAGYASSRVAVFDVKRGAKVLDIPHVDVSSASSTTCACCHRVVEMAAIGYADKHVRLLDFASGKFVKTLSDHQASVTSVCMDSRKEYCLISGCHDGNVRIFDLRMGRCIQTVHVHQSKYDEAVHHVHLAQDVLATAGADGTVGVLLNSDSPA